MVLQGEWVERPKIRLTIQVMALGNVIKKVYLNLRKVKAIPKNLMRKMAKKEKI